MKFIFPQNYKFNTKIYGIIDYQTALIDAIWIGLMFIIINNIFNNLKVKIFLLIVVSFPILLFSILGINGENIITVIIYMTKYLKRSKIFFYSK